MNFFQKILDLQKNMPRVGMSSLQNSVNSDYTCYSAYNKNCYLLIGSEHNDDCLYGNWMYYCRDCVDCDFVYKCELCCQCADDEQCYNCDFCQDCTTCTDCTLCYDCKACQNCFACAGLRNKQFHIFNKPVNKDEYGARIKDLAGRPETAEKLEELKRRTPRLFAHVADNENCVGDYLYHSKNSFACFDCKELEDCMYMTSSIGCRDCMDMANSYFGCELSYEVMSSLELYNCNFCNFCYYCRDCEYCEWCDHCNDCFGCFDLQHKQFYIFNEPYTRDEYFKKVAEIKKEMRADGTYGKHLSATIKIEDSAIGNYWTRTSAASAL